VKVLIAEDDLHTREGLAEVLQAEGYRTVLAADGKAALTLFATEKPDVVCLDIMMPELDGYEVCRRIRRTDSETPVLFISAKGQEIDRVVGLELGADDFIVKPFGVREVVARIRAVTRRTKKEPQEEEFEIGDLRVAPGELRAYRGKQTLDLQPRDILLLRAFAQNRGRVLDRDTLFDVGWGVAHLPNSRTLDQHISQLRKRIEIDPKDPQIIRTVHTIGYRYDG
jgi:DNA-binding response OmpR family regulator